METPKTKAGRITERIMEKVLKKLPEIETHEYNRTYEAILDVLTIELPESGDVVRYPHGGGMFIERGKR